jgi:hypothetical protein
MTTPPKYHDLVLLDDSNSEKNASDSRKLLFIVSLFLLGVVLGATVISLLHGGGDAQVATTPLSSSKNTDSLSKLQVIVPTVLQPIAEMNDPASNVSAGCSIESLGRNAVEQGCAVDDYKEDSTGVAGLDSLTSSNDSIDKTKPPESDGVTNILDLQ